MRYCRSNARSAASIVGPNPAMPRWTLSPIKAIQTWPRCISFGRRTALGLRGCSSQYVSTCSAVSLRRARDVVGGLIDEKDGRFHLPRQSVATRTVRSSEFLREICGEHREACFHTLHWAPSRPHGERLHSAPWRLICLIHQTNYLLDQQLRQLERAFLAEGGLRERMTRARLARGKIRQLTLRSAIPPPLIAPAPRIRPTRSLRQHRKRPPRAFAAFHF